MDRSAPNGGRSRSERSGCVFFAGPGRTQPRPARRNLGARTRALRATWARSRTLARDLWPEGAAGALANSVTAALDYYERFGAEWERQMLIQLRAVTWMDWRL
ncbi:MAG: hypothetical protein IH973_09905 [Myxococcales bacterium]|nr:hypothetical protein [Myxococcales bacterium]